MGDPAIFLDRDGTIIEDVGFLSDPDRAKLTPRAGEGLKALAGLGMPLIVVTNQSGVARKVTTEDDVAAVNLRVLALVSEEGAHLDGFYYCPHHPEGDEPMYAIDCECRKPKPGMLERAAMERGIDLSRSFMIGDSARDLQAGRSAGTKRNGSKSRTRRSFPKCFRRLRVLVCCNCDPRSMSVPPSSPMRPLA